MASKKIPTLSPLETSFSDSFGGRTPSIGETPLGVGSQTSKSFPLFICITEYNKRMDDELDMKPGDKIQVITDDGSYNDGWYLGKNMRTREEGLYPKLFTQEIAMERKPALMRAKSSKRVASPLATGSTSNLSYRSQDGSTSELSTPHPLETAQPAMYRKYNGVRPLNANSVDTAPPVDRNISVKSTMSDIDKALEELRGDTYSDPIDTSQENSRLGLRRSDSGASLDYSYSNINGIETKDLSPENVKSWSPEQVTAYLISIGFDIDSASRFQKHKISGTILLELELAHLKELEINSFGTRFEIFKEVEALKEVVSKASSNSGNKRFSLMPAASFQDPAELRGASPPVHDAPTYRGHLRKSSRSMEELPSSTTPTPKTFVTPSSANPNSSSQKPRPASLLFTNETTKAPDVEGEVFTSPRRAPKPPSYPSPVQPPKSPMINNQISMSNGRFLSPPPGGQQNSQLSQQQAFKHPHPTIYEQVTDGKVRIKSEKQDNSNDNDDFQFPKKQRGPTSSTPNLPNPYGGKFEDLSGSASPSDNQTGNRGSVIYSGHKKTKSGGSFVELFNRISMLSAQTENDKEESQPENNVDSEVPTTTDRPSSSIYAHSRATSATASHARGPSQISNSERRHRRNSSLLSFFKDKDERTASETKPSRKNSTSHSRRNSFISPFKTIDNGTPSQRQSMILSTSPIKDLPHPHTKKDAKRRSVSAKDANTDIFFDAKDTLAENEVNQGRSVSEATKLRSGRNVTPKMAGKQQTTAFTEGIRSISVNEAMKTAECSGWMSKKGTGAMGVWKNRFFTLHGTRLSYFANTTDTRERGLIDITAHRVLPAKEDDKFVSLYAASTGKGRYCFKLVPPQPGSKKGLTFTQPRIHYFAVDTKDEMRAWIASLIKATIDIDTSVPIISSCATPTVSLSRAQEMLAQAREETKLREQERSLNEQDEDQMFWDQQRQEQTQSSEDFANASSPSITHNTTITSGLTSPYLMADHLSSNNFSGPGSSPNINLKHTPSQQGEYFGLDPKLNSNRF